MRAVRFKITGNLLREALHLPESSLFVDAAMAADWINRPDTIEFTVVDESIPEAEWPHDADPIIQRIAAIPEQVIWDWNLPINVKADNPPKSHLKGAVKGHGRAAKYPPPPAKPGLS